jgi:hypothetical protein
MAAGRSPPTGTARIPKTAEGEFFVAGAVEFDESPLSAVVTAETAQGVGRTLSWLLGW